MKKKKKPKISTLKNKLWAMTSQYVRLKYADNNGIVSCFTCGTRKHWKEVDAGHGIGGRGNMVLFDLDLIRPQCKSCNGPPGYGRYYEFGKRLNVLYGEGWYEDKEIQARKPRKITLGEYEEMIDDISQKLASVATKHLI